MFKSLLTRLLAFLGRTRCRQGFHKWEAMEGQPGLRFCTREGCSVAQQLSGGVWVNGVLPQVTLADVQKLNRHERRRLGSMARRGAFGKVPTTAGGTHD